MTARPTSDQSVETERRRKQDGVGVGVYDAGNQVVPGGTVPTAAGTPGAEPVAERDLYDEPRTAPRTGPTTYSTVETPRRGGVPLVTWVTLAIVALVILWLVFAFVL